ncbi:hypothetical protein M9Y10_035236 [Tritrichomonas musculus]|uniref:Maltase n=1 Tax=Tritrichomonas musculus TaxID=1915356 RepID=A0ABR2KH46_9EUKA
MFFAILLLQAIAYLPRRSCENMSFCRDNINIQTKFRILKDTINFNNQIFSSNVLEENSNTTFQFTLYHISKVGFRFRMEPIEQEPFTRYDLTQNPLIINSQYLNNKDFSMHTVYDTFSVLTWFGSLSAEINYDPFRIEIKNSNQLILTINKNNFLNFNKYGKMSKPEEYDGFVDPIKNGLTSVSCDFEFPEFVYISGFGSRSSKMNLEDGTFRMFNHGGFSNYGTIPFLIAHSPTIMASLFWINPTDTFVDISRSPENFKEEDQNLYKQEHFLNKTRQVKFLSESSFIDFIINIGIFNQLIESYTDLTGKPSMPPIFAFGYHQSHWGYKMQEDVENVINNLDKSKIPFDCFWLDIDHLSDHCPFTVNTDTFPDMNGLIEKLRQSNRFLVRITDPHISVHQELAKEGLKNHYFLLQYEDSKLVPFHGHCWPGESLWPDFLNKEVVDWWSDQFDAKKFPMNVFIWNDMNEPSIFQSIDGSFPKNLMHGTEYEDREVHNIYGLLNTYGTYKGLLKRSPNERPFILSRSHFSGSQKFVWLWSGDNIASWKDLESSIGHLVNFGISGFPFAGTDVGGFMGNPSKRLLFRWFQAASWTYPFFREHSHIDSSPREPYLYDHRLQKAISDRYKLLPLFYTAARISNLTGIPIVRPLWAEFPDFPLMHLVPNQLLIADTLLVCPVVSEKVDIDRKMGIKIPPGCWFDFYDGKQISNNEREIKITDKIPVFIRGGKIFATFSEVGKNVNETLSKPLTLHVALDQNGRASGDIYLDDGHSFNFTQGELFLKHYSFIKGTLKMRNHAHLKETIPSFINDLYIDKVVIYGTSVLKKKIKLDFKGKMHQMPNNMIVIDNVKFNILGDFTLFDGVDDSGIKVRSIVFKAILIFFGISFLLPLVAHLFTECKYKNKRHRRSSEEILIDKKGFGVQSSLESDFDSDSISF